MLRAPDVAPAVPGPSISSGPIVSETVTARGTLRYTTYLAKDFNRDLVLPKEEEKFRKMFEAFDREFVDADADSYADELEYAKKNIFEPGILGLGKTNIFKKKNVFHSGNMLGNIVDVFDAKHLGKPKYGGDLVPILDFKKDPLVDRLTKCAKLVLDDYNSEKKTNYRFVNFEMAVWQPVAGVLYHITFRARNVEKECNTFQATVFADRLMREVVKFRMKGSVTWYPGTMKELIG